MQFLVLLSPTKDRIKTASLMEVSVGVFELNVLASKGEKSGEAATQVTVATPPSQGLSENFS